MKLRRTEREKKMHSWAINHNQATVRTCGKLFVKNKKKKLHLVEYSVQFIVLLLVEFNFNHRLEVHLLKENLNVRKIFSSSLNWPLLTPVTDHESFSLKITEKSTQVDLFGTQILITKPSFACEVTKNLSTKKILVSSKVKTVMQVTYAPSLV